MYLVVEVGWEGMESVWFDVMKYRLSVFGLYIMILGYGGY